MNLPVDKVAAVARVSTTAPHAAVGNRWTACTVRRYGGMAADRSAAYCYFGGPWDGELVMLQPGWPFPAAIEHPEWLDGHYRADDATRRYVWRAGPWRAEIRP